MTSEAENSSLPRTYSAAEECFHVATHALGAVATVAWAPALCQRAAAHDFVTRAGCGIYIVSLVLMYSSSTAYHAVPPAWKRTKQRLRTLDHCSIFVLIAGTYTAFALTVLRGWGSYALLAGMWTLCAAAVYRLCRRRSREGGRIRLALGMGWLVIAVGPELARTLEPRALLLLVAGGVVYTLGVPFYIWRRLPHHHGIWHGFVLLGSLSHFVAIALFALPNAP